MWRMMMVEAGFTGCGPPAPEQSGADTGNDQESSWWHGGPVTTSSAGRRSVKRTGAAALEEWGAGA
jgi:hypothetical protein